MTDAVTAAAQNGSAPLVPHAAEIVQQLRSLIGERELRLAELDREREQIQAELKTYEQAIRPLTGEVRKKRKQTAPARARGAGTRVGDERVAELKEFIRSYADEHEEFRQVDIRAGMGQWADGAKITSSSTATAFEALRQEPHNFLRIGRVDGNSKYYRLTREAVRS